MSQVPKTKAPGVETAPMIKNTAAAPFVVFDNVPVFGTFQGNLEVEVSARSLMPKRDGTVVAEMICTGHLRCSPAAAIMLIDALQKALDMHQKQAEDLAN